MALDLNGSGVITLCNNCGVCGKESKSKCSNCNQIYYCSTEHQKQDWKQHKKGCHPYMIKCNEKVGRYLVTSRNIKSGEIVLKDQALICGPSQAGGPVCIGCMKGLKSDDDHVECKCGWAVCSSECIDTPEHFAECNFTLKQGAKVNLKHYVSPHPIYQCLTAVRCLLLKEWDPKKWEKLIQLESHENLRRGSAQWQSDQRTIAKFIPILFNTNKFSEDEIMKITGILQINGHEIPLSEPPYIAVYDHASLIEHSCIPNLTKSFTKKGDVIFWATNPIKIGTNLSICYSDALWGTLARQSHLLQTKLFKCECLRCKDVTELGTNYSSILCNKDECKGLCLPITLDAINECWKCMTCKKTLEIKFVNDILERAGKDLSAMEKGNLDHCKKYINHYSKWLPKNHHYLCEVKVVLSQLIGSGGPEVLQSISENDLMNKIDLCRELINLYKILTPSESRILGLLSFELHAGLAECGRRHAFVNNDLCKPLLEESLKYAEKTINYLEHEPAILSEGQVCKQAKMNHLSLKQAMNLSK